MGRKRVALTGGVGFIGSQLVEGLVRQRYYAVILDDLSTGRPENLGDLLNKGEAEFIKAVLKIPPCFMSLSKEYGFDFRSVRYFQNLISHFCRRHTSKMTG